jgi:hypothetical protein
MLQKHWGDLPEVRDEALRDLDAVSAKFTGPAVVGVASPYISFPVSRLYGQIEGLPGNPLDALIQGLGGKEAVAELTGRSVQWGQGPDGTWEYLPKANDADAHEVERRAFMDGRKLVAIVSEAASIGISVSPLRFWFERLCLSFPVSRPLLSISSEAMRRSLYIHP